MHNFSLPGQNGATAITTYEKTFMDTGEKESSGIEEESA